MPYVLRIPSIQDVKNDLIRLVQSIGFEDGTEAGPRPGSAAPAPAPRAYRPGEVLEISKAQAKGPRFPLSPGNVALLKAVLTAGLYPNVAKTAYQKPVEGGREPKKVCLAETTKGSVAVLKLNSDGTVSKGNGVVFKAESSRS